MTTAHRVIIGVMSVEEAEGRVLEVARRIDRGEVIEEADYFLSFPSASQLFRELSPACLALL